MSEDRSQQRGSDQPKISPLERFFPVALACPVGISLSVFAFLSIRQWEEERIRLQFERRSSVIATSLQKGIDENIEVLWSIQELHHASNAVEREEFGFFLDHTLKRRPGIRALEWVPRVSDGDRRAYEAEARRDGFADLKSQRMTERAA